MKIVKCVILGNWTEQGRKTLKDLKKRFQDTQNLIEKQNGSMTAYFTMGEYDFVMIVDMPNDDGVVKALMKMYTRGNATTTTLKVLTDSEFMKMISEM